MSKTNGAISGFLGGAIFSIMIYLSKQGAFQIRILLNRIWGLPFPLYETLSMSTIEFWVRRGFIIFCFPIIAILWAMIGIWFTSLGTKQQWNRKHNYSAWVLWGISNPVIGTLLLLIIILWDESGNFPSSFCNGYEDCAQSIATIFWVVIAGILSGVASALYSSRWYAN